jgi:hypothetical protein
MRKVRLCLFWLECAVKLVSTGGGDGAILSIDNGVDFSGIKTIAFNSNILATGGISNILADFENDWKRFCLITIGIIEITHHGLFLRDSSSTSLPHHGNVLVSRNGSFSDLASGSTDIPVAKAGVSGHLIFKVDQISTYLGVDEWKLITIEILDESHGILWIEPYLSH